MFKHVLGDLRRGILVRLVRRISPALLIPSRRSTQSSRQVAHHLTRDTSGGRQPSPQPPQSPGMDGDGTRAITGPLRRRARSDRSTSDLRAQSNHNAVIACTLDDDRYAVLASVSSPTSSAAHARPCWPDFRRPFAAGCRGATIHRSPSVRRSTTRRRMNADGSSPPALR